MNEELNDQVFNGTYRFIKIHKEKFNDRFTILYVKDDSKHLKQNDYSIGGYLDMIDKTIYDANYELKNITPEDSIISIKSFADLHNEFKEQKKNIPCNGLNYNLRLKKSNKSVNVYSDSDQSQSVNDISRKRHSNNPLKLKPFNSPKKIVRDPIKKKERKVGI